MMKKILFVVFAFTLILSVSPAGADAPPDFIDIYTVDADGSTAAKSSYDISQTPWLYLHIPGQYNAGTDWTPIVGANWSLNSDPNHFSITMKSGVKTTDREFWLTPLNWNSIKSLGDWSIYAGYVYFNSTFTPQQTSSGIQNGATLTITPEPISMALFGLGAGVLGLAGFRRRKKLD
jgi:hypothetical protein